MATFAIAPDITTLNLSGTDGQIDLTYRIDDPDNSFSNSDIGSAAVTIFFNNEVLINVDQISLGDINGTPVGTIPITGGRSLSEDTFDIDGNLDTTSFALVQLRNLNPIETVDGAVLLSIPFSTTGAFDGQTQISFDASNLSGLGVPDITPVTVLEGAPTLVITPQSQDISISDGAGEIILNYRFDNFSSPFISGAVFRVFFNDEISVGDIVVTNEVGTVSSRSLGLDSTNLDSDDTTNNLVRLAFFPLNSPTSDTLFVTIPFTTTAVFDGETSVNFGVSNAPSQIFVQPIGSVTATVTNQAPVITSAAEFSVPENITALGTIVAEDADAGDVLEYSISGGVDAALFAIDAATGDLTFIAAPDYEVPGDDGADNVYNVQVQVTDGANPVVQDLIVTVTGVNEAVPVITSAAEFSVAENLTAVGTIVAEDADAGDVLEYSISGGVDAALFAIDAGTGDLTFIAAPDYEVPGDDGGDNVYNVQVSVTDGFEAVSQDLTVTVTDLDEIPPIVATIAASDANAAEEGLDPGEFTITLSEAAPEGGLTVSYTVGGTADANDYTALTGTVTIAAGETTATIALTPLNDELLEPGDDETVVVTLTDAEAYDLGESNEATVTIADNDAPSQTIELSTPDTSLNAGEAFVVTVTYDVTDADNTLTGIGVRVHYDSSEIEFDESAVLFDTPFAPIAQGPEEVSDGDDETDSQVTFAYTDFTGNFPNTDLPVDLLTLSFTTLSAFDGSSLNVTFIDGGLASGYSGQADSLELTLPVALPTVTIAATTPDALEAGEVAGRFIVTLDQAPTSEIVVKYSVAGTATATDDYTALSGTVTIAAGQTTATIDVTPVDDSAVEAAETVIVTLSLDAAYDLGAVAQATVTIADNDVAPALPKVTIAATKDAAEQGSTPGQFTVTLDEVLATDLVVNYTVAGTATTGDYTALSGTVTIAAGQITATIDVTPVDDSAVDAAETVVVTLTDTSTYDLGITSVATVTIADNDVPSPLPVPVVTIEATTADTAEGSLSPGQFTVTLDQALASDLVVNYTVVGTATATDDYTDLTGQVTIAAGQTTATIDVTPVDDVVVGEGDEIVTVILTDTSTYDLGTVAEATVTIADNDPQVIEDPDTDIDPEGVEVAVEDASDYFSDLFSSPAEQQAAARAIEEIQKSSGGLANLIDKLTYTLPDQAQAVEAISQAIQQATLRTDAAFDNLLGFYVVEDATTGAVKDAEGNIILPGQEGYAEAALANVQFDIQVGGSQVGTVGISNLVEGVAYAPFVIANGAQFADNPASVFDANPDNQAATAENYTTLPVLYFGFAEANPDFAPHIKRLEGGDLFGFEDLPGGIAVSDNDFNDATFSLG